MNLFQSPLWHLVLCRLRLFYRQPAAVFWTYGFPLMMITALGLAFRGEQKVEILVDTVGPVSESILVQFRSDTRFVVKTVAESEWKRRLQVGKTDLVLHARANETPELWIEPRRAESRLAQQAVENVLLRAKSKVRHGASGQAAEPEFPAHYLEEKGTRYIDFLLPGMIGMNLMGGGMWGVGFVLVDMRVRKLLKRFLATPMRQSDFLLSVMIARLFFAVFDMVFLVAFGYLAFGVAAQGNPLTLILVMLIGGASFSGIGLLVASRAQTVESVSGLMNLVMLPMWIASGVFFSAERFPAEMQPIIQALPLTCLTHALRAVMLEGLGLTTIWPQLLILTLWGSVCFGVALKIFRWK